MKISYRQNATFYGLPVDNSYLDNVGLKYHWGGLSLVLKITRNWDKMIFGVNMTHMYHKKNPIKGNGPVQK